MNKLFAKHLELPELNRSVSCKGSMGAFMRNNNLLAHKELAKKRYCDNEVMVAKSMAKEYVQHNYFLGEGIEKMWEIHHVLTSDDAWGSGSTHVVSKAEMYDLQGFMHYVLEGCEPPTELMDLPGARGRKGVVDFMSTNHENMEHTSFMPMLRTYLYAYPDSSNSFVQEFSPGSDNTSWLTPYTALQMACKYHTVPLSVMKAILEAGVSLDAADNLGSTPLMSVARCPETACVSCNAKMDMLLAYGAKVDIYDTSLKTCLHIAAQVGNVTAVRKMLRARQHQIDSNNTLYIDPLFHRDYMNKTVFAEAVNTRGTSRERTEMIELLTYAGQREMPGAKMWMLDHHSWLPPNKMHAWVDMPQNMHLCYGSISCLESKDAPGVFQLEISIHRQDYSTMFKVRLSEICTFLNYHESTIKDKTINRRHLKEIFRACNGTRFDFFEHTQDGSEVSGCDFNILVDKYANMNTSTTRVVFERNIVCHKDTNAGSYHTSVLAFRFPKGPFETEESQLVAYRNEVRGSGTIAHLAATCHSEDTWLRFVRLSIPQCNILVTCNSGYSAMDVFYNLVAGDHGVKTTQALDVLATMEDNHYSMMSFIHRECLLSQCIKHRVKPVGKSHRQLLAEEKNKSSRFHILPDDICMRILSYM